MSVITSILCETDSEAEVPVAVLLFDGEKWNLRTVNAPTPEMMADIKRALQKMAKAFDDNGF